MEIKINNITNVTLASDNNRQTGSHKVIISAKYICEMADEGPRLSTLLYVTLVLFHKHQVSWAGDK